MKKASFQYLYGPVYSWRLGMSLGVDPLSKQKKICNFDCIYCQLGKTHLLTQVRKEFVPTQEIIAEIKKFPFARINYITFSGRGEPTLARNLGKMIKAIKDIRPEKIAVITNSFLLAKADVRADLMQADFVLAKLDASCAKTFHKVNRACARPSFNQVIAGLCAFRKRFKGKLALQIMFIKQNKGEAKAIAALAKKIQPSEIQLNTPLRPCAVKPLTKKEMNDLKKEFSHLDVMSVYDVRRKKYRPLDEKKTISRHGKYKK